MNNKPTNNFITLHTVEECLAILQRIIQANPIMQPFRSGGFVNKDYDMARISIDLPIIEARRLMAALKMTNGSDHVG